jgi:hypothetical protein
MAGLWSPALKMSEAVPKIHQKREKLIKLAKRQPGRCNLSGDFIDRAGFSARGASESNLRQRGRGNGMPVLVSAVAIAF